MALMPRRRDRPPGGWAVAMDSIPSNPSRTRTFSRSRLPLRSDLEAPWSPSPLEAILAEFTTFGNAAKRPQLRNI